MPATELSRQAERAIAAAYDLARRSADGVSFKRLRGARRVWVFESEPYEFWAVVLRDGLQPADVVTAPSDLRALPYSIVGILKRFYRPRPGEPIHYEWDGYADESGFQCVEGATYDFGAIKAWHQRLIEGYGDHLTESRH